MIKVFQTIFDFKNGNCFQACVASVLELPLEDVPNFCAEDQDEWLRNYNEWLRPRGLGVIHVITDACSDSNIIISEFTAGYHIAGVEPTKGEKHAVVIHNGIIVHDPHPRQNAFKLPIIDIQLFTVQEPWKVKT